MGTPNPGENPASTEQKELADAKADFITLIDESKAYSRHIPGMNLLIFSSDTPTHNVMCMHNLVDDPRPEDTVSMLVESSRAEEERSAADLKAYSLTQGGQVLGVPISLIYRPTDAVPVTDPNELTRVNEVFRNAIGQIQHDLAQSA